MKPPTLGRCAATGFIAAVVVRRGLPDAAPLDQALIAGLVAAAAALLIDGVATLKAYLRPTVGTSKQD